MNAYLDFSFPLKLKSPFDEYNIILFPSFIFFPLKLFEASIVTGEKKCNRYLLGLGWHTPIINSFAPPVTD